MYQDFIQIKEGTIEEAYSVFINIPEFEKPYPLEEFKKRLKTQHLILLAYHTNKPIGFKIGYSLDNKVFYSWLGGILPNYRKKKIAEKLMVVQEAWAKKYKFFSIKVKTRNCFKGMLLMLIKQSYLVTAVETKTPTSQNRIIFMKKL